MIFGSASAERDQAQQSGELREQRKCGTLAEKRPHGTASCVVAPEHKLLPSIVSPEARAVEASRRLH